MIFTIVEGSGDELALPILVQNERGVQFQIACKSMEGKSNIVRKNKIPALNGFEETIKRQTVLGHNDFVVLLDDDVLYPPYKTRKKEHDDMNQRALKLQSQFRIRVRIFWATINYESWIIGGLLRNFNKCMITQPVKTVSGDTQAYPPNPKKWIEEHFSGYEYNPKIQVCLTRHMHVPSAKRRNHSLRLFLDSL